MEGAPGERYSLWLVPKPSRILAAVGLHRLVWKESGAGINRSSLTSMHSTESSLREHGAHPAAPVTVLTVFTLNRGARLWGLAQMWLARPLLREDREVRFRKLMGSGRGIGFTRRPDWERYALLTVWPDEESARRFLETSRVMRRYARHTVRSSTLLLRTLASRGRWDGIDPFGADGPAGAPIENPAGSCTGPIGVLTRATIRPTRIGRFWSLVAPVAEELCAAPGLLGSIGIGEAPLLRQATFSLWESIDAMKEFAYGSPRHRTVIERTRREGWYSEDLFARFAVIDIIGEFP